MFFFSSDSVPNIKDKGGIVCKLYKPVYCIFPKLIPVISDLRPIKIVRTSAVDINK